MLFNRNIEPSCIYCRFSRTMGNGEYVCSKRGIMSSSGYCSTFKYEPTKREPQPLQRYKASNLSEEEFSL